MIDSDVTAIFVWTYPLPEAAMTFTSSYPPYDPTDISGLVEHSSIAGQPHFLTTDSRERCHLRSINTFYRFNTQLRDCREEMAYHYHRSCQLPPQQMSYVVIGSYRFRWSGKGCTAEEAYGRDRNYRKSQQAEI